MSIFGEVYKDAHYTTTNDNLEGGKLQELPHFPIYSSVFDMVGVVTGLYLKVAFPPSLNYTKTENVNIVNLHSYV